MPIDVGKVGGARLPDLSTGWTEKDVILYHLGVGAGDPPTSEAELSYCYEGNLKVLPSFATIPPLEALANVVGLDGIDVNPMLLLHGEHEIEIHRPLPVVAQVRSTSRVTGVYDKGKSALIKVESISSDENGPLFTNRASLVARGEGGFSGAAEQGRSEQDSPGWHGEAPARVADLIVECPTIPQQALLYRLSGDRNPLHVDPAVAAIAGFDRPILHGLCTFGIVCKAVVGHSFEGNAAALTSYGARFAGVVFPGETLLVSLWQDRGVVDIEASTAERDRLVLTARVHGTV